MLSLRTARTQLSRRWMAQLLLVFIALIAFCSWKWLLERSLENERVAWEQRFRVQQEQQLKLVASSVKQDLEKEQLACLKLLLQDSSSRMISRLLKDYSVTAILLEEPVFSEVSDRGASLEEVLQAEIIDWSSDEEGRDFLAARLMPFSARDSVWQKLRVRLNGEEGPPMKASFRHWLIEEARRVRGEVGADLDALSYSESLRATGAIPERGVRYEGAGVKLWWSEEMLITLFAEKGVTIKFGKSGENFDLWGTRWKIQPDVVFDDWRGADLVFGYPRLLVVGVLSGFVLFLGLLLSSWLSNREHKLARLRTDLAASVAHELRTPLAGQRILLESLGGDLEQSEADREDYLRMALQENWRLSSLAEQFLTFSRLERGKLVLQAEEIQPAQVVDELLGEWRDRFDQLSLNVEEGLTTRIDGAALNTILRNLIENAWKYTKGSKLLGISMSKKERDLVFLVEDNGPGLSEREKRQAFAKFWRADQRLSRETEGLGLGLFIVKKLVQAHGGYVEVGNSDLGGAKFVVILRELE